MVFYRRGGNRETKDTIKTRSVRNDIFVETQMLRKASRAVGTLCFCLMHQNENLAFINQNINYKLSYSIFDRFEYIPLIILHPEFFQHVDVFFPECFLFMVLFLVHYIMIHPIDLAAAV